MQVSLGLVALFPLLILYAPAEVSSSCDDLLDQLNDISFMVRAHYAASIYFSMFLRSLPSRSRPSTTHPVFNRSILANVCCVRVAATTKNAAIICGSR